MAFMTGWLPSLVLLLNLSGQTPLSLDAYVPPSGDLGLGIATLYTAHDFGRLQLQLAAEAEWDLQDTTLVPIEVAVVHTTAPMPWLLLYVGVATNVTIERLVSGSAPAQTSFILAAALRAGAAMQVTERFAVAVDFEYAIPVSSQPLPEAMVEVGPSFSF